MGSLCEALCISPGASCWRFLLKDGSGTYHYQKSIDESISCEGNFAYIFSWWPKWRLPPLRICKKKLSKFWWIDCWLKIAGVRVKKPWPQGVEVNFSSKVVDVNCFRPHMPKVQHSWSSDFFQQFFHDQILQLSWWDISGGFVGKLGRRPKGIKSSLHAVSLVEFWGKSLQNHLKRLSWVKRVIQFKHKKSKTNTHEGPEKTSWCFQLFLYLYTGTLFLTKKQTIQFGFWQIFIYTCFVQWLMVGSTRKQKLAFVLLAFWTLRFVLDRHHHFLSFVQGGKPGKQESASPGWGKHLLFFVPGFRKCFGT